LFIEKRTPRLPSVKRTILSAIRSRPGFKRRPAVVKSVSEERYRSVVDNSPYGIYRVSFDGRFVTVNPALCAMVGYSEEELFAANISVLYPDPDERTRLLAEYDHRPHGTPVDVPWRRKDGRVITTRVWVYADRDESGRIKYFDGYVEDVTPLRATEQALRQSEKLAAVGQLVSGVAHELNNPLSAILLFTEDLLASERSDEEQEALGIIAQQARRSRAIVRDLLSFVRSRDVMREPIEPNTFLGQVKRALQPQLAALGVTLHVDVPPDGSVIHVDRAGIEQVVTNLVINAAQAVGKGGNVWLAARTDASQYVIEVTDDGSGIPSEVMPRIFEPFFTTKPMGQGTGLGLSVSLGVVQQHGGSITVENGSSPNAQGARFIVRLPMPAVAIAVDDAAAGTIVPAEGAGARHVLIIDDEATIRRALNRFYSRRGWTVTEAEDGASAFEHLVDPSESFDLVISDVKMPDVSGIQLHAALQTLRPDLLDRMVFCTGEVESPAVASFVAETGCKVLLKPFDLKTLATISDDVAALRGQSPAFAAG
jgi:PAS domain S-box-containing protein